MPGLAEIARAAGVKKHVAEQIFEEILSRVSRGEKVNVKGFGTFRRGVSKGRVLQTPLVNQGKPLEYEDTYLLKFKASTLAKRRINIVAKKAARAASAQAPRRPKKE